MTATMEPQITTPSIPMRRVFTTEGVHPYETVTWEPRDVVQKNWKTDEVIFEQRGVEFPSTWSDNAVTIVTTKYFRGAVGSPERESSLKDLIGRVVDTYVKAAHDHGYLQGEALEVFEHEMKYMLVHQMFSFNSPVWFNVGTSSPQQVSACFILAVDDSMDSILNWYREEGLIFKGGSGAGLNLSRIRSSKELLRSSGGTASGPVSFMRGADASAGTIKSGGATRRAAKMVVLDIGHPDIMEFVETKEREEEKIRVLRDAGFDMDLGGADITSVQYQNANNSVRVSDEFMRAVRDKEPFGLRSRTTGEVVETVDAVDLFTRVAQAAWACADPGIQYDDTINTWHTSATTGRINASNPCSEYMHLDNSSCNLASLNLMKFVGSDGEFDHARFTHAVEVVITAMDISICFADFPTAPIGETTRRFRQLGIGYANLGALLMSRGLAYDSPEGRAYAAAITSLMTGVAYRRSTEIAEAVGAYDGYAENSDDHARVMDLHREAAASLAGVAAGTTKTSAFAGLRTVGAYAPAATIAQAAAAEWVTGNERGAEHGWRNAQASVLAPTGTIGFMMDCDTTGIEPDFSLLKFKKLVGGGSMQIVNQQVPAALRALGYTESAVTEIVDYVKERGHVVGAPAIRERDVAVFDCAAGQPRSITPDGHINMMAAVQPFLSGAISKTVNLPESATVEEIADIYMRGWDLDLKAVAVYRDNCKVGQPLSDSKGAEKDQPAAAPVVETKVVEKVIEKPIRRHLPRSRASITTAFTVGGAGGYMTSGAHEDGTLGEVFLKLGKQGSTLAGVMDAFSIAVSVGLQYGVPLETYVQKFTNLKFEPSGLTDDPDVRMSQSIMDYVFRRLAIDYLPKDVREAYGIFTVAERNADVEARYGTDGAAPAAPAPAPAPVKVLPVAEVDADVLAARAAAAKADAPECMTCETSQFMQRAGACYVCSACGGSTGCS